MKRALTLSLILIVLIAWAATAEQAPVYTFSEAEAGYDGAWVRFEDGFELYLPAHWTGLELTPAQRDSGIFYRAGGAGMSMAVSCMPCGDLRGTQALTDSLSGAGFTHMRPVIVNGMDALLLARGEECLGTAFYHPLAEGYVLLIYVAPCGEAGSPEYDVCRGVLMSLRLLGP